LTSYDEYIPSKFEKADEKPGLMKPGIPMDLEKGGGGAQFILPGGAADHGAPTGTGSGAGDLYDDNVTVLKRRKTSKRIQQGMKSLGMNKPKAAPRATVRFGKEPAVTIIEEDENSPLIRPNAREEMDDNFKDYANLPPTNLRIKRRKSPPLDQP
jgi:hypothetical protein